MSKKIADIKELREILQISQQDLANLAGLVRGSMANIELNARSGRPSALNKLHHLIKQVDALDTKVSRKLETKKSDVRNEESMKWAWKTYEDLKYTLDRLKIKIGQFNSEYEANEKSLLILSGLTTTGLTSEADKRLFTKWKEAILLEKTMKRNKQHLPQKLQLESKMVGLEAQFQFIRNYLGISNKNPEMTLKKIRQKIN